MALKRSGALAAVLAVLAVLAAAVVTATLQSDAAAAEAKPPPPPKPVKPPGNPGLVIDQYPPSANDDVVLRWDLATLNAIRASRPAPTVAARAHRVTPFALSSPGQFGPPTMNRGHLPAEAKELLDLQSKLTDVQKTSAYYWADGPGTTLPPGHWAMFAQAASRSAGYTLDQDVQGFFALGNGLLDASIATWNAKRVQDTVRPITYIRWLYAGKTVKGWKGAGTGTTNSIDGSAWIPYQEPSIVTPAFAEYTSGHSAFSGVASRVFSNFVGTDAFKVPLTVTVPAGSSTIEPGLVPARATVLTFKSFADAADQAGLSRRYGGIHFTDGDLNGRALGAKIGDAVWAKAQTYFSGTAG